MQPLKHETKSSVVDSVLKIAKSKQVQQIEKLIGRPSDKATKSRMGDQFIWNFGRSKLYVNLENDGSVSEVKLDHKEIGDFEDDFKDGMKELKKVLEKKLKKTPKSKPGAIDITDSKSLAKSLNLPSNINAKFNTSNKNKLVINYKVKRGKDYWPDELTINLKDQTIEVEGLRPQEWRTPADIKKYINEQIKALRQKLRQSKILGGLL